ncbi:histidine--tRNA ligase [Iodidimonas sp. SYSU 1G8]|uniref:histidine--tRNA ligase n=1 Tax=Iodidimonas sp. SYSU 1G8 TaxID=3133967 RepID=UPI0031FF36D9
MAKLQPVRGTHDLLPEEARRHQYVIATFRDLAERYGYGQIETPIFEFTEVFDRSLGETTDVVTKEMYTFQDRGGESLSLRPEPTAGIARAFISGGLAQHLPLKFFAYGPMFRHERPQKGRLRQFHQLDIEVLGVPEPQADIEVIALGAHLLEILGVREKVTLELNTLGDTASRTAYRDVLVEYFSGHEASLSEDSRMRLRRNPLRILDSKDEGDRRIVANAPQMGDYLNDVSKDFFARVKDGLDALGQAYTVNDRLVRGFDYYTHTAFEFTTTLLGAQSAVIGGGRYDHLIEYMGGPSTAGIGWGCGIERLVMLLDEPPAAERPVAVIPVGADGETEALVLTQQLRRAGVKTDIAFRGNVGKRMKQANKVNARAAILVGGDELARGAVALRDLDTGEQVEVARGEIVARLGGN